MKTSLAAPIEINMIRLCPNCECEREVEEVHSDVPFAIGGLIVTDLYHWYRCLTCKQEFATIGGEKNC